MLLATDCEMEFAVWLVYSHGKKLDLEAFALHVTLQRDNARSLECR